jgi:PTS system ascorbate-specific IIC component
MELLKFIVFDILGVTPLLVGFIALIGLLIQRKPIEKVLSGTFKTIVGFLVFAGGAGLAVTSLGNFQTLFSDGFGLKGVMPLAEAQRAGKASVRWCCRSCLLRCWRVWRSPLPAVWVSSAR